MRGNHTIIRNSEIWFNGILSKKIKESHFNIRRRMDYMGVLARDCFTNCSVVCAIETQKEAKDVFRTRKYPSEVKPYLSSASS